MSDGVSLWALHRARRPPDKHYPYGHGKFEAVGSACVGGMLVAAGGGMGIHAVQAAVDLFSALEVGPAALGMQLQGIQSMLTELSDIDSTNVM